MAKKGLTLFAIQGQSTPWARIVNHRQTYTLLQVVICRNVLKLGHFLALFVRNNNKRNGSEAGHRARGLVPLFIYFARRDIRMTTLYDQISTSPDTEMFAALVDMVDANLPGSNLVALLSDPGALTVFVPSDDAMMAAAVSLGFTGGTEADAIAYLFHVALALGKGDPWPFLEDLLTYHMVAGNYTTADLSSASPLTTVEGATLTSNGVTLTDNDADTYDAEFDLADVSLSNGTLHVIDTMMLPAEILPSNGVAESQLVIGGLSADHITTGAGDDYISSDDGSDIIDSGAGNDVVLGWCGNDQINAGDGEDYVNGGNGRDVINGGAGADTILGDNGTDTIHGDAGNDIIDGGNDDDVLYGDDGDDEVNGGNGNDQVYGGIGNDLLTGGRDNDILDGGEGNDTLDGGSDNDTLTGGAGSDTFVAGPGAGTDVITDFENGIDKIDVTALGIYTINAMTITQVGTSTIIVFNNSARVELLNTVATSIDASDFILDTAPVSVGTESGETLHLGDGADLVNAGGGSDKVYGYGGNDTINAGSGEDFVDGGSGDDVIDAGSGKDHVKGGDGDDWIYGMASNDLLFGGNGADYINGGADNDRIYGGTGNDMLIGENGNDKIWGEAGADTLLGGAGKDQMDGGDDNDILNGGFGDDTMTGGDGIDTFVFEERMRADTIVDFTDGVDLLDVSALGYTDVSQMNVVQVGADTVITFSDRDSITLQNFDAGDLGNEDFIF